MNVYGEPVTRAGILNDSRVDFYKLIVIYIKEFQLFFIKC